MARSRLSRIRRLFRALLRLLGYCMLASILWVFTYKWVDPPITALQIRAYFRLEDGADFKKTWVDFEDVHPNVPLALVAAEDQRFAHHWGFDWEAIKAAAEYNRTHTNTRGASTITQQVAKNVFLWPQRSWIRKGLEAWFTLWIELFWSKERILEVYMNVAETGEGIFGVEAASQTYFKKPAAKLSRREAALLAATMPSPKRNNPGKPTAYLSKRGARIEYQMRILGKWDWENVQQE